MKTFRIPVEWTSYGVVEVEAETVEEAIAYAHKNIDELPLPYDGEYMEDSYAINDDEEFIKYLNKDI